MLRRGTYEDITRLTELSEDFWAHAWCEEEFIAADAVAVLVKCLQQDMLCVYEVHGTVQGYCCGLVSPLLGNSSVKVGVEVAWWLDPEHRKARAGIGLVKMIEQLAKENGVKYWNMMYMQCSMPKEVKSMYERMQYTKTETTYTKVL